MRLAYLTDIHLQPERGAVAGLIACLRHVQTLEEPPQWILNGGDTIMDAVAADRERATLLWDMFERTVAEHCRLPLVHCLGNHDIWGWNRKRSGCTGAEPEFGKRMALDRLKLESPYYAFERGGWRFLVLDSSFDSIGAGEVAGPASFTARLDDAQFSWLAAELSATPARTPIALISHCPIVAGASLFFSGGPGETERTGNWVVPSAWMHIDARPIVGLLLRFPNVRLCLSGHTHHQDRLEYGGITFINSGAVSGRWWRNQNPEPPPTYAPPGYGLLDLHPDGSFDYHWMTFPLPTTSDF